MTERPPLRTGADLLTDQERHIKRCPACGSEIELSTACGCGSGWVHLGDGTLVREAGRAPGRATDPLDLRRLAAFLRDVDRRLAAVEETLDLFAREIRRSR